MKIAIIADIHGNLAALEATLAAIEQERPDQIVCLGDVAATGPQPREVIARLRALDCPMEMGNADAELLDPPDPDSATDESTRKVLEISRWGSEQLDDVDRAFLASFQPTVSIDLGVAGSLLCCHGSPRSYDDSILADTPEDDLETLLGGHDAKVYACGHTHIRILRTWRERLIFNPGSVGLAWQQQANGSVRLPDWAEYAMLTSDADGTVDIDFPRAPYAREATVQAMFERGMPHADWWSEDWR